MEWIFVNDSPIWMQLSMQLRQRIVAGVYPVGEKLPSVRELAGDAGVNPNTMQRALSQLDAEELTVSNRTSGRTVTENKDVLDRLRESMAQEKIESYLTSMAVLGFSESDARNLLIKRGESE